MKTAEWGSYVKIQFSIKLENGSIVGDPQEKTQLNFKIGDGKLLPALERNVVGMAEKEIKHIQISSKDGYGDYNKELVLRIDRNSFPPDINLTVGRTVQYQNRDGERVNFVVNAVDDNSVTVDGNHPLAGLDLTYEVELLEVV
ncbi:MAG: FKBP-type peptidyl-prolyl cis-trans isomerase [Desulforhopalus sp.]